MRIWLRIPSNNALHAFLSIGNPYNAKIMMACGLDTLPDRRTFDRRFEAASLDLRSRIGSMGELFVNEKFIDPYVVSVDSTLLKAKGHVWHRSSMEKGFVYSWRSKSIEPLFEQIKDVFGIDPLPTRGFDKAKVFVLLSVLLYQLTVYYNGQMGRSPRELKHMLGS